MYLFYYKKVLPPQTGHKSWDPCPCHLVGISVKSSCQCVEALAHDPQQIRDTLPKVRRREKGGPVGV